MFPSIRRLHEHRLWTRLRLIDVAVRLSPEQLNRAFPIGFGSVLANLHHMHVTERAWIMALHGEPDADMPALETFAGLGDLLRRWSDVDDQWDAYLDRLDATELQREVRRKNRAGLVQSTTAHDVLLHVCTHAFYHAAQAVNMFRHLGVEELPNTNLITMAREQWLEIHGAGG